VVIAEKRKTPFILSLLSSAFPLVRRVSPCWSQRCNATRIPQRRLDFTTDQCKQPSNITWIIIMIIIDSPVCGSSTLDSHYSYYFSQQQQLQRGMIRHRTNLDCATDTDTWQHPTQAQEKPAEAIHKQVAKHQKEGRKEGRKEGSMDSWRKRRALLLLLSFLGDSCALRRLVVRNGMDGSVGQQQVNSEVLLGVLRQERGRTRFEECRDNSAWA
jgi:hypothetical protein